MWPPRARHLVDSHQRHRAPGVAVDGHQGDVLRQVLQRLTGRLDGRDDDDPRDPVRQVPLDRVGDGDLVQVPDTAHADREALLGGGLLQCRQQRGRAVQGGVLRDHADDLRPARHQRASGPVGPVAQLGDRRLHPQPGLLPDVRVPVEHPRHGLMGDPGKAGHIRHRGTPHGTHPPRQALDHARRSTPEPRDAPSAALHPPRLNPQGSPAQDQRQCTPRPRPARRGTARPGGRCASGASGRARPRTEPARSGSTRSRPRAFRGPIRVGPASRH